MLTKVLIFVASLSFTYAESGGYGGGGGGYSGSSGGYGGSGGYSGGGGGGGIIPAAIQTRHTVDIRQVNLPSEPIQPQTILVDAGIIPLNILFRSASSALNVLQQHIGGNGDTQETQSEDEPHRLVHEVTKPIIQEVREIITPFRKVVQEIQPVQEEIQTIVARGEQRNINAGVGFNAGAAAFGTGLSTNYGSGATGTGFGSTFDSSFGSSFGSSGKSGSSATAGSPISITSGGKSSTSYGAASVGGTKSTSSKSY